MKPFEWDKFRSLRHGLIFCFFYTPHMHFYLHYICPHVKIGRHLVKSEAMATNATTLLRSFIHVFLLMPYSTS